MSSIALLLLFVPAVVYSFVLPEDPRAGCSVHPFDVNLGPVVIKEAGREFLYPEYGNPNFAFDTSQIIDVACANSNVTLNGENRDKFVQVRCVGGSQFTVGAISVDWSQISCQQLIKSTVRTTSRRCEDGGVVLEIGIEISSQRFLTIMNVCFDEITQGPKYTAYNITASIGNRASGVPRPGWSQPSGIYNLDSTVNSLYTRSVQRQTINTLVGLDPTSEKYIQTSTNYYLARGHLTARVDYFFGYQQNSTFWYINQVPQWQTFNGYNWENVESSVRSYADKNGLTLQLFTGVHGVATLPHEITGEQIELYLYVDANNNKALPVPDVMWKVVYDPLNKLGIALLGINNPYKTNVTSSIICKDISDSITWVNWDKTSIERGYSFACDIDDLRKTATAVPQLEVRGLLL